MSTEEDSIGLGEALQRCRSLSQEMSLEVAELRTLVAQLRRRSARAEFLLEKVYQSWTWRVGRVLLFPASIVRFIRNKRAGL